MLLTQINMRKISVLITMIVALNINAQSNKQMAASYIKKANEAIEKSIDYTTALINFNKAIKYMDGITDAKVASLGARAYFEIHHKQRTLKRQIQFLEKSNLYSQQYFKLVKNKNTNSYASNVEIYSLSRTALKKLKYKARRLTMRKF